MPILKISHLFAYKCGRFGRRGGSQVQPTLAPQFVACQGMDSWGRAKNKEDATHVSQTHTAWHQQSGCGSGSQCPVLQIYAHTCVRVPARANVKTSTGTCTRYALPYLTRSSIPVSATHFAENRAPSHCCLVGGSRRHFSASYALHAAVSRALFRQR